MGATVIDELVVELGLDPAKFTPAQRQVVDDFKKTQRQALDSAKEIEKSGQKAAEFFTGMKREALGLFAVLVGANGLKNFTAQTVTNFAAIGRAAQVMGMRASDVAAFSNMIVRAGGDAAAARQELLGISQALEQWKLTGDSPLRKWFNFIGANANDSPLAVLQKFAKFAETHDAKLTNLVGQGLGFDEATITQAMHGQAALNAELEKSRKLGVPTDDQIRKTMELQRAWFELKQAVTGDAQALLEDATPALVTILDFVAQGIRDFPELTKAVIALGAALVTLGSLKSALGVMQLLLGFGGKGAAAAAGIAETAAVAEGAAVAGGAGAAAAAGGEAGLFAGGALAATTAGTAGTGVTAGGLATGAAAVAAPAAAFLFGIGAFGKAGEADETDRLVRSRAVGLIKKREGFKSQAYWDRNAWRVGYGSDTVTDEKTGLVTKVSERTRGVTRAQADADLSRRVGKEFAPRAARQVGDDWNKLDPATRAALIDMAYNYGSLPKDVAAAVHSNDRAKLADAVQAHQNDNGGVNAGRRVEEANAIRQGAAAGQAQAAGGSKTVTNHTEIGAITVQTQATDAAGIARDLGPAIRRQNLTDQANTGLG